MADPYDPLDSWIASELAVGVALFVACDVGFRRALGIRRGGVRLAAAALALATIPVGLEVASVQIAALTVIVAAALVVEARRFAV